jgi:hypothetical protein
MQPSPLRHSTGIEPSPPPPPPLLPLPLLQSPLLTLLASGTGRLVGTPCRAAHAMRPCCASVVSYAVSAALWIFRT